MVRIVAGVKKCEAVYKWGVGSGGVGEWKMWCGSCLALLQYHCSFPLCNR